MSATRTALPANVLVHNEAMGVPDALLYTVTVVENTSALARRSKVGMLGPCITGWPLGRARSRTAARLPGGVPLAGRLAARLGCARLRARLRAWRRACLVSCRRARRAPGAAASCRPGGGAVVRLFALSTLLGHLSKPRHAQRSAPARADPNASELRPSRMPPQTGPRLGRGPGGHAPSPSKNRRLSTR